MGKVKQKALIRYTDADVEYIRKNYGQCSIEEISSKLGRTKGSVYQKARLLKVFKTDPKIVQNEEVKQVSFTIHNVDVTIVFK